jgi:hypothetical protein
MENEEIIKLAVRLTEENNSFYKQSARQQAFMIKAKDLMGTEDTFITVKGLETADEWKNKFNSAGFIDVVVSPFRSSGNLTYSDVDSNFLDAVSKRAKWQREHSPSGLNTPFTAYNPYAGKDKPEYFDKTDTRISGASYSSDSTNKYQDYILKKLSSDKAKIFAGWYDGSLIDWVKKIASLSAEVDKNLQEKYANLLTSPQLLYYFDQIKRRNPEYNLKVFKPTDHDVKVYHIEMKTLSEILSTSSVDLDEYPEELILPVLDSIIETAYKHKFHKQYTQKDMDEFQQKEIDDQLAKDVKTWNVIKKVLRGISR